MLAAERALRCVRLAESICGWGRCGTEAAWGGMCMLWDGLVLMERVFGIVGEVGDGCGK